MTPPAGTVMACRSIDDCVTDCPSADTAFGSLSAEGRAASCGVRTTNLWTVGSWSDSLRCARARLAERVWGSTHSSRPRATGFLACASGSAWPGPAGDRVRQARHNPARSDRRGRCPRSRTRRAAHCASSVPGKRCQRAPTRCGPMRAAIRVARDDRSFALSNVGSRMDDPRACSHPRARISLACELRLALLSATAFNPVWGVT